MSEQEPKKPRKIKSVDELPEWFFKRDYSGNLSAVEWYREIRRRQSLQHSIDLVQEVLNRVNGLGDGQVAATQYGVKIKESLLSLLEMENIRPDAKFYDVSQAGRAVHDLTVMETVYLSHSLNKSGLAKACKPFKRLLKLWSKANKKMERAKNPPLLIPYSYEKALGKFVGDTPLEKWAVLDSAIHQQSEAIGNPLLSYGRPLNGYPVTIDTQFDDQTILGQLKQWLAEVREQEETKAKRPFNQNDLDDWKVNKIREAFDLQAWATIQGYSISNEVMGQALWPDALDAFSPEDKYRKTAKKKVQEVFTFETVVQLYGQLVAEKGTDFLSD